MDDCTLTSMLIKAGIVSKNIAKLVTLSPKTVCNYDVVSILPYSFKQDLWKKCKMHNFQSLVSFREALVADPLKPFLVTFSSICSHSANVSH